MIITRITDDHSLAAALTQNYINALNAITSRVGVLPEDSHLEEYDGY